MTKHIEKYVLAERNFLHDLSSPLTVAHGTVSVILEKVGEQGLASFTQEQLISRLNRTLSALEKMTAMLNKHRDKVKGMVTT